jgi:hypothetical protein
MTWLSLLIIIKAGVTIVLIALPLLFLPKVKLEKTTNITAPTPTFFRLYGVALLALIVGYVFGIFTAEQGLFPWGVVCMATISNGGAALFLLLPREKKRNKALGAFFALIALGLVLAMVSPETALQKAW